MIIKFNPRFKEEETSEWVVGLDANPEDLHYTVDEVKRFFGIYSSETYGTIYRLRSKALRDAENLNEGLKYMLKNAYETRDEEIAKGFPPDRFIWASQDEDNKANKKMFPTTVGESIEEIWDNYIHDLRVLQGAAVLVELKRKIVDEIINEIK